MKDPYEPISITQMLHVWYIYLYLVDFYGFHVAKYSSPMDPMGMNWKLQEKCR